MILFLRSVAACIVICHVSSVLSRWKMVKDALDSRGWVQVPFEQHTSTKFNLKWVERRSQIDYKTHVAGQVQVLSDMK